MNFIGYHNDVLHIEELSAEKLADQFDTPLYVYSKAAI
ncbi:MAG: diaminopimelate decarboxylase, partial [Candidatus Azotimanducaceae bacterium]